MGLFTHNQAAEEHSVEGHQIEQHVCSDKTRVPNSERRRTSLRSSICGQTDRVLDISLETNRFAALANIAGSNLLSI